MRYQLFPKHPMNPPIFSKLLRTWKVPKRPFGINFNKPLSSYRNSPIVRSLKNGYYFRNPTTPIIWGIIGINGAIFLAWQYATGLATNLRDPSALKFMHRHFTLGNHSLRYWHTFLTAHFSHNNLLRMICLM
jgi:membrane associated rhomboid family serine protease